MQIPSRFKTSDQEINTKLHPGYHFHLTQLSISLAEQYQLFTRTLNGVRKKQPVATDPKLQTEITWQMELLLFTIWHVLLYNTLIVLQ